MNIKALLIKTPKVCLTELDYRNCSSSVDSLEIKTTECKLHAKKLARNACLDGKTLLIAAGGDGTVNEIVNGMFDAKANNVTLAVLRCGSGNDFARSLGIFSEKDSYEALRAGKSCPVDLGKATYVNFDGAIESRFYCNFAGAGIDAEVAKNVERFRRTGRLDYILSIITTLATYKIKPIKLEVDGSCLDEEPMYFVNLANGRYGARGLKLAPNACINDGLLDLVIADRVTKPEALALLPRFYAGTHIYHRKFKYLQAKKVRMWGEGIYVHLDGEVVGNAPVTLEVIPKALNVFYLDSKTIVR